MALIVTGMIGSGKSVLRRVCNSHPLFALTEEFKNFNGLNVGYNAHASILIKNYYKFSFPGAANRNFWRLKNMVFMVRYLSALKGRRNEVIGLGDIEAVLKHLFPHARLVGDVCSQYLFKLDSLVALPGLLRTVVYRDCRDVVSCTLRRVHQKWARERWAQDFNTAEKIAQIWVREIGRMDRHADHIHKIRYEDLVTDAPKVLSKFGNWLGVNPAQFSYPYISDRYVGEWKGALTGKNLADIIDIAGAAMSRCGYI